MIFKIFTKNVAFKHLNQAIFLLKEKYLTLKTA
jgi:hypothetical protein